MTTPNNGGAAFPALNFIVPHDLAEAGVRRLGETQGMTMRDAFAIAAMPHFFGTGSRESRAAACYAEADAMLAARGAP